MSVKSQRNDRRKTRSGPAVSYNASSICLRLVGILIYIEFISNCPVLLWCVAPVNSRSASQVSIQAPEAANASFSLNGMRRLYWHLSVLLHKHIICQEPPNAFSTVKHSHGLQDVAWAGCGSLFLIWAPSASLRSPRWSSTERRCQVPELFFASQQGDVWEAQFRNVCHTTC